MTLAELVEAVNALPTTKARIDCANHLRAFYGWPDIHAHDLPHAFAAVASFEAPQGAVPPETAPTGIGPSDPERRPEAATRRPIRDDSPEARADRLAASAATQRLTAELGGTLPDLAPHGAFPDMRPTAFWNPDSGPRIPIGVYPDWFTPGAEADMLAKDRGTWNEAWSSHGGTMAARSRWENERAGRAVPLLVAADDQAPF